MRDADKLKEKVELSLDNRQVVSLIVGSLVVLGMVFVLGVLFGKQLAGQPVAVSGHEALSSLDREPDAGPIHLTFQDDLTRPLPPAAEIHGVAARSATSVRAEPHPDASSPGSPRPPPHAADGSSAVPPSPAPAVSAKPPSTTDETADDATAAKTVAPVPAPAPPPAIDKKLADAFTAAKSGAPVAIAPASAQPAPSSGFTVQVAASQDKAEADQALAKLTHGNLKPYLVEADIPGKGHWYRVRVGTFPSRGEADAYARDLHRETGVAAFATSVR